MHEESQTAPYLGPAETTIHPSQCVEYEHVVITESVAGDGENESTQFRLIADLIRITDDQ
ncbi:MAG: hypothetical protein WKF84_11555 [Pyrinomonadaceae bacterium]